MSIVVGNINTEYFFRLAVGLLLETIDGIVRLSGKETHEKGIICVDGKESCGSRRRDTGMGETRALQTLNVYAEDYRICIGQKFIREKTNEIPAAQELLPLMDLKDSIVTTDAMNCQKETVSAIVKGKGDYVLALKGNQPLLYDEVREYFDKERLGELRHEEGCWYKTTEKEHGGIPVREYYITEDVGWYSEKEKWEKLKSFGMVKKTVSGNDGGRHEEARYYICSIGQDTKEFERAARGTGKLRITCTGSWISHSGMIRTAACQKQAQKTCRL